MLQQLNYAQLICNTWLNLGPSVWLPGDPQDFTTDVVLAGKRFTTYELSDLAVYSKRSKNYASSIGTYIRLLDAYYKIKGVLPLRYMMGLYKALLCANAFTAAFSIASTIFADIQHKPGMYLEKSLFGNYFSELCRLSSAVVDQGEYAEIYLTVEQYAGCQDYKMVKTFEDCYQDLKQIRDFVKQHS